MARLHKEVWRIINGQKTSTGRTTDGKRIVRDGRSFRPLPESKVEAINAYIENYQETNAKIVFGQSGGMERTTDVKERAARTVPKVLINYTPTKRELLSRVKDSWLGGRDVTPAGGGENGGYSNLSSRSGVMGQDPSLNNLVKPNLWMSPWDVAAIYSQKGLPETILKKKSQSILLNGVRIRCALPNGLTPEQHDKIDSSMEKTGVAHHLANALNQSLGYGGALLYPMFKKDNPMTMGLPIELLARHGVVGKGCISRYVPLDRWNVVHVPSWDPTAEDWLNPKQYYIPFLGAEVSRERCARIVTAPQNGYWGNLMTLGWGLSDIVGWYEAWCYYENVTGVIPSMLNQMSLLVRTLNVDGLLAAEGSEILDRLSDEETMRIRESSVLNPINMDVIGKLEAINRDFKQVPELYRLLRQNFGAKANVPEELIWSSERGAFASGDSNDSAYEKQSEGVRYTHIDVAQQAKKIAQLEVINALGLDRDVLKALPYIYWEFDNPRVTNAMDKAKIGGLVTKGIFDTVAAGVPVAVAVNIGQQFADEEFHISNELMVELQERQAAKDKRDEEKHAKEMELMDAQIEQARNPPAATGGKAPGKVKTPKKAQSDSPEGKGHSYKDPLEQRQHERVGQGQKQGLAKAQAKTL